jgi:hypothetical protein
LLREYNAGRPMLHRPNDAGAFGGLTRNRLHCAHPVARPIVPAPCRGNHARAGTHLPGPQTTT